MQIAIIAIGCRIIFCCVHHVGVRWKGRATWAVSGVCGKRLRLRKVTRRLLKIEEGGRRTSLAQQYYRRQTNPPQITSTLHRKHGRLLLSPRHRQGRLSLRTSSSRTTDPFGAIMRRIRDGRTALRISRRWNTGRQMEYSTMADMLRTTACDRCPQHHVRRCLPPFRRQLQGCPAVSSYQGLQQGRGGLHPVCYRTPHAPSPARFARQKDEIWD